MKILITGAAGFIGFHTSKKCVLRGDEVIGFDNLNDYYDPSLKNDRLTELKKIDEVSNGQLKKLRKLVELNGKLGEGNYLPALTGIRAQRT